MRERFYLPSYAGGKTCWGLADGKDSGVAQRKKPFTTKDTKGHEGKSCPWLLARRDLSIQAESVHLACAFFEVA